ncbi:aromatase/cyclase [Streptomyces sulphureus]|uniref:aromatase/cyclase n=1 Tax=Streptomyces sulphureus TaxID=47758 RepID=UPI000360C2CD|nr:aromatase/cyclase [Streptomyces sulphureus]
MASELHESGHEIKIGAPADTVYHLLAHAEDWPRLFPPNIHVDHVERSEREERIRIWATADDTVKNWISHRTLDHENLRIRFRQEVTAPPVAAMGGTWHIAALPSGESLVRLTHDYRAVDTESLSWLDDVVDNNSRAELESLRTIAESGAANDELTCSFEDTVRIKGSATDVYDFIDRADRWTERLPHVRAVRLEEPVPGLQTLEMDTVAKDGISHTTKSYRVGMPPHRIVYKQVTLPALLSLHTGRWTVAPDGDGVTATSQHTISVDPDAVARVLGADATVRDAIEHARTALSTNSLATLTLAREYAERRAGDARS